MKGEQESLGSTYHAADICHNVCDRSLKGVKLVNSALRTAPSFRVLERAGCLGEQPGVRWVSTYSQEVFASVPGQ